MKFTYMGFSQKKLVEHGLDLVDAAILRYFIDFKNTGKMVSEKYEGEIFYWVQYEKLLDANPIFKIKSKDALRRRFKKLTDAKILIHYHKQSGGSYSFYGVGENYEELIIDHTIKKSNTCDLKVAGDTTEKPDSYYSEVGTKDSSIKDSSTKNIHLLKHTLEDKKVIEKIMCVLDKQVTFEEAKKILKASKGSVDIVKEKYEVAKKSNYNSLVPFIIIAIKEDYQMPKKQEKKSKIETRFHNFESRTSNYTTEQLERMVLKR